MRIGDEVEIVFLQPDRTLLTRTGVILEGRVLSGEGLPKDARELWVTLDEQRYQVTDDKGVLNQKVIRVTFIRHSEASQAKKINYPIPKPPTVKPTAVLAKPAPRPIPRDPRTIGSNSVKG